VKEEKSLGEISFRKYIRKFGLNRDYDLVREEGKIFAHGYGFLPWYQCRCYFTQGG
jgi:hypothetical protein